MRSVVITGVSSGIGYEASKLAIEKGAQVFGSVRRSDDATRLQSEFGEGFIPLLFDVRDEEAVRSEAQRVRSILAGHTLSGLVNNVGIAIPGPVLHQPMSEIRDQIATNLIGSFLTTQAFAPLLGADRSLTGPPGRIVNISSIGGKIGQPFASAYIASKHGLEGFSDTIRREMMLHGIDVIIVAPGPVRTPLWNKLEPLLGRYTDTPYGEPFERGLRTMITVGHDHSLEPEKMAETIWHALTIKHPKPRYAPAEHPILEQALPMAVPRRVLDWAMTRYLKLKPGRSGTTKIKE
jgi:NAD(P)-dependent dehydrogenase (short-subunit alcohol dehydrogenase family)